MKYYESSVEGRNTIMATVMVTTNKPYLKDGYFFFNMEDGSKEIIHESRIGKIVTKILKRGDIDCVKRKQ